MSLKYIQKEKRTPREVRECWEILMHSDSTITRTLEYDPAEWKRWDRVLTGLSLCSKSRLLGCEFCPFQFKCNYLLKIRFPMPEIARVGSNLHLIDEKLWTNPDFIQELRSTRTKIQVMKTIRKHYYRLIPRSEVNAFIHQLASAFIQFETNRITGIFDALGNSSSVIERYVQPVSCEIAIENYSNNTMGIIDRIDRTTNDTYVVVEYKYGKPKYVENRWDKRNINTELCFYFLLLEGEEVFVVERDTHILHEIEEFLGSEKPLPYYGAMLFFQDIHHTDVIFKLSPWSITSTRKKLEQYWDRIDRGMFDPTPILGRNSTCWDWCKYYENLCEFNPYWQAIERCVPE